MTIYRHLETEQRGAVRWLWLNRPDVRNAFNDVLIAELSQAFADVEASPDTRVVVMAARGPVFSAGADLTYMRAMAGYTHAENHADALKVARMFHAIHSCSRPVVARIHGDAFLAQLTREPENAEAHAVFGERVGQLRSEPLLLQIERRREHQNVRVVGALEIRNREF